MNSTTTATLGTGCLVPAALLVPWETALVAAALVPVERDGVLYWNLDALDAATLTALCQPRAGA